jgi:dihydroorotate dehydrogenase (NAD+) catalytic subunit
MPKFDLNLATSFMNAAGSLGFTLPADHPDKARLGAFITNPISEKPRAATRRPRVIPYPGGILLHTGYPNPGLKSILRRYPAHWQRLEIPVIVHLLCSQAEEIPRLVARLETVPAVMAIELGLPPQASPGILKSFARASRSELPVILRIPLDQTACLLDTLVEINSEVELNAISLGPPRGLLPDGEDRFVHGRLYGPGLFPQALAAVKLLVERGLTVIGAGGVYSLEQAERMIAAGAHAVQLDTVLWRGPISEK